MRVGGAMHPVRWLTWFVTLTLLWLLYAGQFRHDILVVGSIAAAVAALFAVRMQGAGLLAFRLSAGVVIRELRAVLKIYPDFARILTAVLRDGRSPRGGFRWVDFPYAGSDDESRAAADRAIVTTTSSIAPSSSVV